MLFALLVLVVLECTVPGFYERVSGDLSPYSKISAQTTFSKKTEPLLIHFVRPSLKQSLRALANRDGDYFKGYELSPFVDGLPACLWDLSKAFSQLEKSLLDYVALYHSVYLSHILHLLSDKLKVQFNYTLLRER